MSSRFKIVPIIFVVILRSAGWAYAAPAYTVTVIPCLPGDYGSGAGNINASGQVIGSSNTPSGHSEGYLWSNGVQTSLGLLPGGTACDPMEINNSGQIVGGADDATGFGKAFLYQNGAMTNLGTLPGDWMSVAYGINASGQVVGISGSFTDHAFLYSNGTMTNLTAITGVYGGARAINDRGEIVGFADITAGSNGILHAYDFTTKTDLGTLGGQSSDTFAINNSGQAVGYADTASGAMHPALFSNGHVIDLGNLGGNLLQGMAYAINSSGDIVGIMNDPRTGNRPFLYSGGQMVDLNSLIDPALGYTLSTAGDINDSGQIVADGWDASRQPLSVVLTPAPEPSMAALLVAGAASFLAWQRRRRRSPRP